MFNISQCIESVFLVYMYHMDIVWFIACTNWPTTKYRCVLLIVHDQKKTHCLCTMYATKACPADCLYCVCLSCRLFILRMFVLQIVYIAHTCLYCAYLFILRILVYIAYFCLYCVYLFILRIFVYIAYTCLYCVYLFILRILVYIAYTCFWLVEIGIVCKV